MLNTEKTTVHAEDKRKADAEWMAKTISNLPETERNKLFYMLLGIELTVDKMAERRAG